jgi:hypothetical protein
MQTEKFATLRHNTIIKGALYQTAGAASGMNNKAPLFGIAVMKTIVYIGDSLFLYNFYAFLPCFDKKINLGYNDNKVGVRM